MSTKTSVDVLHQAMVDQLVARQTIPAGPMEHAFRRAPRHLFLPEVEPEKVYSDQAIPTRYENGRPTSSSSQPSMMAIMLAQLDLQPGQRVLEIGAGTGYNAALMAQLVGQNGHVTTIDLDEDIAAAARAHLDEAGFPQVDVICADGAAGYAANAPYDRIILTVGSWDVAPAWVEQLQPDGRLLLPLSINGPQFSIAFDRAGERLTGVSIRSCGFMRMRGALAEPLDVLTLDPESNVTLRYFNPPDIPFEVDPEAAYRWLTGPHRDVFTGVETSLPELWRSFDLWCALYEPQSCSVDAQGEAIEQNFVPPLFQHNGDPKWQASNGIVDQDGLCLLTRASELPKSGKTPVFELGLRSFGPDKTLANRLALHLHTWDAAGRPLAETMQMRLYPVNAAYQPINGEHVLARPHYQLVVSWPK